MADAVTPLIAQQVYQQRVSLVGRPSHGVPGATLSELLARHPVVLPTLESGVRTQFDALVARLGLSPQIAAEVDDMAMMRLLAREGAGLAVLPPIVVKGELEAGMLVEFDALPGVIELFYAVTVKRRFPNPMIGPLLNPIESPSQTTSTFDETERNHRSLEFLTAASQCSTAHRTDARAASSRLERDERGRRASMQAIVIVRHRRLPSMCSVASPAVLKRAWEGRPPPNRRLRCAPRANPDIAGLRRSGEKRGPVRTTPRAPASNSLRSNDRDGRAAPLSSPVFEYGTPQLPRRQPRQSSSASICGQGSW